MTHAPVMGDVYDIASQVQSFDPAYRLRWNEKLLRYQVIAINRRPLKEGHLNGAPFYVVHDVESVIFTWDVEGMAPDERIIRHLRKTDAWKYPGGPEKYYDDLEREMEEIRQKRKERMDDFVEYQANQRAPYILDEMEGTKIRRTHYMGKVV